MPGVSPASSTRRSISASVRPGRPTRGARTASTRPRISGGRAGGVDALDEAVDDEEAHVAAVAQLLGGQDDAHEGEALPGIGPFEVAGGGEQVGDGDASAGQARREVAGEGGGGSLAAAGGQALDAQAADADGEALGAGRGGGPDAVGDGEGAAAALEGRPNEGGVIWEAVWARAGWRGAGPRGRGRRRGRGAVGGSGAGSAHRRSSSPRSRRARSSSRTPHLPGLALGRPPPGDAGRRGPGRRSATGADGSVADLG